MQSEEVGRVASALEGVVRVLTTAATTGELSLPAGSVLGRLVRGGPQRLTELAVGERVSQPAMTQLVGRLERDGLVGKYADDSDGRAVLVEITGVGRRVVDQRRKERAQVVGDLLDALDEQDAADIAAAAPALERFVKMSRAAGRDTRAVVRVGA